MTIADRDRPPTEWYDADAVRITDEMYASFDRTDTPHHPTIWHWCHANEVWTGSGTDAHTVVSTDPLHLEPSLLFSWCCGLHGWIRDGQWVST